MFADDILLFFSGFSIPEIACRLTNAVTSLDSWLTTRGLQMNIGKTQAMFVLPRGLNIPPDTAVMCNSRPLQLVTSYKYLGVFLDNRLSWEAQILHITRKVSQKIGALLRAGQQLTLPAKRLFYMAIIAADIEYGSNAFYLFVSFHLIEGKAYLPLQAWCPSNFQSSTVGAISSPLPATSNLPPSSTNGL